MQHLFDEVLRRFPEITPLLHDGDEELPYLYVGCIVEWLCKLDNPAGDPALLRRIEEFNQWCSEQPEGQTASDDIMTIVTVALHEKLFRHDKLLPFVARIYTREDLVRGREYFISWVGEDRYDAAMKITPRANQKKQKH